MTLALNKIRDIYISMEQGNIGRLVIALEESIMVHTDRYMGGNRRGREAILQLVAAFYRPGTGIKKTIDQFIEQDNLVIVLGNIRLQIPDAVMAPMPFADVWSMENNVISDVIFYYRDPKELYELLATHVTGWPNR